MSEHTKYRIGIDVGDRSVGLAAIEFDDDGFPLSNLAMVTYRHDGGLDPTTNKSPKSRKETRGVALRTMRMRRRKKSRLKELDKTLRALGYVVPACEEPQTYEAWKSRALLATTKVEGAQELGEHLVRAVRHMARHRGWRNPWWTLNQLEIASTAPSDTFAKIRERAEKEWPGMVPEEATLGMIGALAASNNVLLRPRTYRKDQPRHSKKLNVLGQEPILVDKVRQEDLLAELRTICKRQNIEDQYEKLAQAVFEQTRPYVPLDRVGKDPLQPNKSRASRASLEFQRFRILDAVAHLRVRVGVSDRRALTDEEHDKAVHFLMGYSKKDVPTWGDVADEIGVEPAHLIAPVIDDVRLNKAPYDRSSTEFEQKMKKKTRARQWWDEANLESRSQLILLVSDPTDETMRLAEVSGLYEVFESWPDEEKEALEGLKVESGRAAYSTDTLNKLSDHMRLKRIDLHEARKIAFGVDDMWHPPLDRIDEPTGQPTVDRVLTIVRRFIFDCERAWGRPENVVIEHARTGLMGPAQRADVLNEIAKNRKKNDKIREDLRAGGINNPTRADIRRNAIVQDQESQCLYCGATIGVSYSELDHIVPRAGGGSSRRENLAAVCRACNDSKKDTPFAVWAKNTSRPVTLEGTIQRLRELKAFKRPKDRRMVDLIIRRLKQTEKDDPIDERSLASTSYAATAIRERIEQYFNEKAEKLDLAKVHIDVYSGSLTRESRRAGGIDKMVLLRGQSDKNRFDVRHHAIDAAVLTLLNRSVAVTLEQRRLIKQQREYSLEKSRRERDNVWRDFMGLGPAAQEKFAKWKKTAYVLADIIKEAISNDAIPVVSPLRLRPQNGSVHLDTVDAVLERTIGDAWTVDQVHRIVNPQIYLAFAGYLGNQKALDPDSSRVLALNDGRKLTAEDVIYVFPEKAASILTPRGVVKIGESVHHVRLYAWKNRKGKAEIGMLRVFGAEFPWLMRESGVKDVLRVPIHTSSQSYRDLSNTVCKHIEQGLAQEIGWVTQNDELEFDPDDYLQNGGKDKLAKFLSFMPENRWRIDGFQTSTKLRVRPALLSWEELPTRLYGKELTESQYALLEESLKKGLIIATKGLLSLESSKIIRRNNLGIPRWRGGSYRPVSLDIQRAALAVLDEQE